MTFLWRVFPVVAVAMMGGTPAHAEDRATETILFIRHGEKPPEGLGQLSCRGLNRALALPSVLRRKYGGVDAVFAPNPAQQKPDGTDEDGAVAHYDYVRPLATVEPSAIAFARPVHTEFGYADRDKLTAALLDPAYRDAKVLVGWEHHALQALVPALVAKLGGSADVVPKWEKTDFDSIWRVTITRDGGATHVAFAAETEGLNGLPDFCPDAAAPPLAHASPFDSTPADR